MSVSLLFDTRDVEHLLGQAWHLDLLELTWWSDKSGSLRSSESWQYRFSLALEEAYHLQSLKGSCQACGYQPGAEFYCGYPSVLIWGKSSLYLIPFPMQKIYSSLICCIKLRGNVLTKAILPTSFSEVLLILDISYWYYNILLLELPWLLWRIFVHE